MKISVLIPTAPGAGALAESLASVTAQAHPDWEVIVLEYGTRGDAERTVAQFAAGRTDIRLEHLPDHGATVARNRLLDSATGDALAFLEPGDIWLPKHLAAADQALTGGADVVVSDLRQTEPKSARAFSELSAPAQLVSNPTRALFSRDAIPCASAVVLRRPVATAAGRFDTRFRGAETRDFWLRCALAGGKFALTRRATCQRAALPVDAGRNVAVAEQTCLFYEKHRDLAAVPAALRRRQLSGSLVALGRLLRKADPGRAARCFWRAWSLQPVHVQTLGQFALTGNFSPAEREDTPQPGH